MPTIHTLGLQAILIPKRRDIEPQSGAALEASNSTGDALLQHGDRVKLTDAVIQFEADATQVLHCKVMFLQPPEALGLT